MLSSPPLKYGDIPENSSIRRFKYATFQGGGMKGLGFVGVIEAMEACGVMDQLEEVAGSSAGAIVALLVALGYTAREIRQEMMALNFLTLQDKEVPGWFESSGLKDVLFHGGFQALKEADKFALLNKLPVVKQLIALASLPGQAIKAAESVEDVLELAFGQDLGLWKGEALLNLLARLVARKTGNPNLTFADLALLAEQHPGKFRALHLTGSNLTTKKLEIYNAANWPDLPLIEAVRISASFPGAFRPVIKPLTSKEEYELMQEDPKKRVVPVRVDGGLLQNLPDIFNHPPYYMPTKNEPGNPEVLALSFLDPESKNPPKFRNGLDLVKALYSTVMSEDDLREKYKNRIAYINPKNVGTLEFDANLEKRLALANSSDAIWILFMNIIESEKGKKKKYEEMTIEELIRNKVAMQRMLMLKSKAVRLNPAAEPLITDLRKIDQLMRIANIPEKDQKEMEEREKARIERRLKGVAQMNYTDEELQALCVNKQRELTRVHQELKKKLKQLKLVKVGFEFRMTELAARHIHKTFQNEFVKQLEKFSDFQNLIKKNRDEKIQLELQKASLEAGLSDAEFDRRAKALDKELAALLHEKDLYFRGTLYSVQNDGLMYHFFQELQEDSKDINFSIPTGFDEVIRFYAKQHHYCTGLINEVKSEIRHYRQEKELFLNYANSFARRKETSERYETLKDLHTELDKSLFQKTGLIAKINNYLVDAKPTLRNITTIVMQGIAFGAFLIRMAVTWPIFGIAHIIRRSSPSDSKLRSTADRMIEALKLPNLFKQDRLREFRKKTAKLLKVLDDNYVSADTSEHTYLYKLLAFHLKNTGLEASDIFPKKEEETDEAYQKRIKAVAKKLEHIAPEPSALSEEGNLLPSRRNVAKLRKDVLEEVLDLNKKTESKIEIELKSIRDKSNINNSINKNSREASQRNRANQQVLEQNLALIHKEFLQTANERIKRGLGLTTADMIEYIDSASKLKKSIPQEVMEQYLRHVNNKVSRQRLVTEEEIKLFKKFSRLLGTEIPDLVRKVYGNFLLQKLEHRDKEWKDVKEFKEGLDYVIKRRFDERHHAKKPEYHPTKPKKPPLPKPKHE